MSEKATLKVMTQDKKPITVGRLKEMLQDVPDDLIVYSEGCDCTEEAYGIDIWESSYSGVVCEIIRKNHS